MKRVKKPRRKLYEKFKNYFYPEPPEIYFTKDFIEKCLKVQNDKNENAPAFYCPICKCVLEGSDYLFDHFVRERGDYFGYWAANLVTHGRHRHTDYDEYLALNEPSLWEYINIKDKYNRKVKAEMIQEILKDSNLTTEGKRRLIEGFTRLQEEFIHPWLVIGNLIGQKG